MIQCRYEVVQYKKFHLDFFDIRYYFQSECLLCYIQEDSNEPATNNDIMLKSCDKQFPAEAQQSHTSDFTDIDQMDYILCSDEPATNNDIMLKSCDK